MKLLMQGLQRAAPLWWPLFFAGDANEDSSRALHAPNSPDWSSCIESRAHPIHRPPDSRVGRPHRALKANAIDMRETPDE